MGTEIVVDSKGLTQFAKDIVAAKRALLGRLAERGYQLLRREVPYETGNLKQGVAPPGTGQSGVQVTTSENREGRTVVDYPEMEALLTVSARSGATIGGIAEVFNAKGERVKTVSLRPQPAYNYAEAVARGRPAIAPRTAKALLIPVGVTTGESYLLIGGRKYVFRKSAAATAPNPFDERAAARLSNEAPAIAEAVLKQFV